MRTPTRAAMDNAMKKVFRLCSLLWRLRRGKQTLAHHMWSIGPGCLHCARGRNVQAHLRRHIIGVRTRQSPSHWAPTLHSVEAHQNSTVCQRDRQYPIPTTLAAYNYVGQVRLMDREQTELGRWSGKKRRAGLAVGKM
jgi:hypothetical protein